MICHNARFTRSLGLTYVKMDVASPVGRWKNQTEHFLQRDKAYEEILAYIPQYVADGMPVSTQFCGMLNFNKEMGTISIPFKRFSGMEGCEKTYAYN